MADVTGSKSIYVGFDLGRYSVQVSYLSPDMDAPMTAEQVTAQLQGAELKELDITATVDGHKTGLAVERI